MAFWDDVADWVDDNIVEPIVDNVVEPIIEDVVEPVVEPMVHVSAPAITVTCPTCGERLDSSKDRAPSDGALVCWRCGWREARA